MLPLKSKIGTRSHHYEEEVTEKRIVDFCKAVGMSDTSKAPPTFLTVFRKGEFDLLQMLHLKLSNALHAEQEYDYEDSIRAGDRVRFETVVAQVVEKQSSTGRLQFLVLETEFEALHNGVSRRVGKAKSTIVFKERTH